MGFGNLGYESRRHRLIGRTVTGGTGAGTQHYVFDGKNMVLAFDGNDNLTDRYLWGPAVDQLLADENYSNPVAPNPDGHRQYTLWALSDNQNSVRDLVTDSGHAGTAHRLQTVRTAGDGHYNHRECRGEFCHRLYGNLHRPGDRLQLHGVRWYDPASQRWLSQDPHRRR